MKIKPGSKLVAVSVVRNCVMAVVEAAIKRKIAQNRNRSPKRGEAWEIVFNESSRKTLDVAKKNDKGRGAA